MPRLIIAAALLLSLPYGASADTLADRIAAEFGQGISADPLIRRPYRQGWTL